MAVPEGGEPVDAAGETKDGVGPYLAFGCLTGVSGFFASAMIAVFVAKLVGYATGCAADADTGAPCNWLTYAVRGGLIGLVVVPTFIISRMRKGRSAARKLERGSGSGSR